MSPYLAEVYTAQQADLLRAVAQHRWMAVDPLGAGGAPRRRLRPRCPGAVAQGSDHRGGPMSDGGVRDAAGAAVSDFGDAVGRGPGVPLMVGLGVEPEPGFALPTGTVTFLLTDVEGSSRRWENAPRRWRRRSPAITTCWRRPSRPWRGAPGRAGRGRQRGRGVLAGVGRLGGGVGRPAGVGGGGVAGGGGCGCVWRFTRARPSCATRGTISVRRSSAVPGCGPSATAVRCWSRMPPPAWSRAAAGRG